jgi:hypothetical protein
MTWRPRGAAFSAARMAACREAPAASAATACCTQAQALGAQRKPH